MEHQNFEKLSLDNTNLGTSTAIYNHFALFCFALFGVGLYTTVALGGFVYMVASQFATLSEIMIWVRDARIDWHLCVAAEDTFSSGKDDVS